MSLKEIYQYVFYKIYKIMDNEVFHLWAEWRANALLLMIEVLFVFSLIFYYNTFINKCFSLPDSCLWGIILVILLESVIFFTFHSQNQWKEIIKKYDALPDKKNLLGTFLVWTGILLIIANTIFAYHLFSKVDWSLYR